MIKRIFLIASLACCFAFVSKAAELLPEKSLYHFKQTWKNQYGKKVSLEDLRGRVRIVAMIYTQCKGACPLIVNTLKRVEAKLSTGDLDKTGFVLFSMDPKRDSPKVLRKFAKAFKLKKERWQLLTSDESNVQELAAALDFSFKESSNGMFVHQNTIFVFDSNGVLAGQYANLDEAVDGVAKASSRL